MTAARWRADGAAGQVREQRGAAGAIESIAAVSEQSAAGAEEVSASTEEQSASVQEMAAGAQELAALAAGLQEVVDRFVLEPTPAQAPSAPTVRSLRAA